MWWFFFFKQKSAYEMRIGDCSSDVCSSDLTIIYRGGPIVTMDGDSPQTVEAVVTKDGRIAYVGDEAGARAAAGADAAIHDLHGRSEEHTSELQSLMRNSYAVFCLKKKNQHSTSRLTHTN